MVFCLHVHVIYKESLVAYCRESPEGVHPPVPSTGQIAELFGLLLLIISVREIIHLCLRLQYLQRNMKGHTLLMLA